MYIHSTVLINSNPNDIEIYFYIKNLNGSDFITFFLNKSWIIHRFLNSSDILDTKNHSMIYYSHSHLSASYSIASTMMDCAIEMQLRSHGLVKNLRH